MSVVVFTAGMVVSLFLYGLVFSSIGEKSTPAFKPVEGPRYTHFSYRRLLASIKDFLPCTLKVFLIVPSLKFII